MLPRRKNGFEIRIVLEPSLGPGGPENLVVTETAMNAA
jgi:hypothetical protein